nr:glycosyltransferase family 2 protein [Oscillochloris sp. ZM17-4]
MATLIIPSWRERGTIEILMRQLRALDYPKWTAVVVAGGPDGTYAAAQAAAADPRIVVIEQRPRGKNAALNDGLRLATGEVVVILDADTQIEAGWLRTMVAPLAAGAAVASTGNYLPLRRTPFSLHGQMEKIAAYQIHGHAHLQGSGGIAMRRTLIDQLGGFPEDVPVGVDWDLDARVAAAGAARAYCPDALAYTERPATLGEWCKNELRWRRAHLASLFRHRTYFFRSPMETLGSIYPYAVGWLCAIATLAAVALAIAGPPDLAAAGLTVWAALIAWAGLSRIGLAIEVAAYTRESRWLALIWAPPFLWYLTLAASCIATLTMRATTMHFKGPRHHIEHEQPSAHS